MELPTQRPPPNVRKPLAMLFYLIAAGNFFFFPFPAIQFLFTFKIINKKPQFNYMKHANNLLMVFYFGFPSSYKIMLILH